jgi:hypothetical protein
MRIGLKLGGLSALNRVNGSGRDNYEGRSTPDIRKQFNARFTALPTFICVQTSKRFQSSTPFRRRSLPAHLDPPKFLSSIGVLTHLFNTGPKRTHPIATRIKAIFERRVLTLSRATHHPVVWVCLLSVNPYFFGTIIPTSLRHPLHSLTHERSNY